MEKIDKTSVSRRQFLTNAALISGSMLGASKIFGAPAIIRDLYKGGFAYQRRSNWRYHLLIQRNARPKCRGHATIYFG